MSGCVASNASDMSVFSASQHQLGRRLYLPAASGGGALLQPATGGVIIFAGQKAYQVTARNPSFIGDELSPKSGLGVDVAEEDAQVDAETEPEGIVTIDWDLEESDFERDHESDRESEVSRHTTGSGYPSSIDIAALSIPTGDTDHGSSDTAPSLLEDQLSRCDIKGKAPEIPRGCVSIGRLASEPWTEQRDDICVIVELGDANASNTQDANTVSHYSDGGGLRVRVTRLGEIRNDTSSLATIATVAEHAVDCQLFTTSVLRSPKGQRTYRNVFQIDFDSHLFQNEDCGAAVLDPRSGEVFGQVICGDLGTPSAYILPMEDIMRDVASRIMNTNIGFLPSPVEAPRDQRHIFRAFQYGTRKTAKYRRVCNTEPRDFIELGSPQYYKDLSGDKMPPRQHLRSLGETLRDSLSVIKHVQPKFPKLHGKTKQPRTEIEKANFFSLPTEICDMIIGYLSFRCAMNFRRVSRACRAAVSINGPAISKRLLDKCPLPPLARRLYPNSLPDLKYVWEVGYRHAVASRLAGHMASWLGREMYQYKSKYQQQEFQEKRKLIQKRLLPSLFTAFHFFEKYPKSLEAALRGPAVPRNTVPYSHELKAMECYSDDVLLQTHDVMKSLITFLQRMVSPPTYYGPTERFLRGYLQDKPSDTVLATILCLGGLSKVLQLADIENYSKRRAEVDKMYAILTRPTNGSSSTTSDSLHAESVIGDSLSLSKMCKDSRNEIQYPLWEHLPSLGHIWCDTAKDLIVRRGIVQRGHELRNDSQI